MTGTTPSDIGPEQAGYQDISVPVYATVKGRASQIRSMPFTGDSSDDSSDGEGNNTAVSCASCELRKQTVEFLSICRLLMVQTRTAEAQGILLVLVLEKEPRLAAVVHQVKVKLGVCSFALPFLLLIFA